MRGGPDHKDPRKYTTNYVTISILKSDLLTDKNEEMKLIIQQCYLYQFIILQDV